MSTVTDPTPERVAEVVAGLTARSRRALVRIGDDWTLEGAPGPARRDAYSLWWGRDAKRAQLLVETPRYEHPYMWAWKLTPLGIAVRTALTEASND
jgi:hypothetical protein